MTRFSVIIPAHNEAAVIERCLKGVTAGAPAGEPEIIVVANGCSDDTAERARRFGGSMNVIELEAGSKPLALNAGNRAATRTPRIFLDADLITDYGTLEAIAEAVDTDEPRVASPRLIHDTSASEPPVKLYYKLWRELPYAKDGQTAGAIALSRGALERIGAWPDVMADDLFIRRRFAREERIIVERDRNGQSVCCRVIEARTLKSLLQMEIRRLEGTRELDGTMGETDRGLRSAQRRAQARLALRPRYWTALAVYLYVKIRARMLYRAERRRNQHRVWRRDETSRALS